ncbi:M28 family metallopeptidase [Psychroserpens sp. BH13MA-6]
MRHILSLLVLLLVFSCKSSGNKESKTSEVTSSEVKDLVAYLASDDRMGRNTGTSGIDESATFIENQLKSYGVKPYFGDSYRDQFKVKELDAFNVVGFIEGSDEALKDEVILLGAHYDHIGKGKVVDGDSIANGANDNAAGTSAVMAIAKYFAANKSNKRSIIVALFTAEEMGLLGSKHLAERLKQDDVNLYTMLNFEMIGVPFKDRDYEAFVTGYELSNMADKINEYVGNKLIGYSEVAKKYSLFKRSDNYPFYQQFNLPCQTISSCDLTNFDFYHHVDDEIDKLDYEFMANLINKTIPAIEKMSRTATREIKMYEE